MKLDTQICVIFKLHLFFFQIRELIQVVIVVQDPVQLNAKLHPN